MRFSVVIPTLGRSSLGDTLESLAACDRPPFEVVVVDGDPDHAAEPAVREAAGAVDEPRFRHVPSPRGASVQRNRGIEAATGDVVVFMDDDAIADPKVFEALAEAFRDPEVVGATGKIEQEQYRSFGNQQSLLRRLFTIRAREGTLTRYGYPRHLQDLESRHEVEFMQGCLMSARREVAADVGFDTRMGGPTGAALLEDEDFSCRLARRGRVVYLPDAVVLHRAAGFRSRDARTYSRLIVLDRAYLFRKNFRRTPLARLQFAGLVGVFFAHRIVNREWGGVRGLAEGALGAWREGRSPLAGERAEARSDGNIVPAMPTRRPEARSVILYELNEVPWEVLDRYVEARPGSNVAKLLAAGRCQSTVNEDPNPLQPWRTWPTFHKALYSDEHNSFELGQDPATFRGEAIWEVADAKGLRIGVFGALQSWPPHEPKHGGFYVPDTFSRTADTSPSSLRRFQEFNLAMTKDLRFSADAPLNRRRMLLAGVDIAAKGLTPWSALVTMRHLVRERRDARYKAGRSILQALPSFDLYWRLHRKTRPHLSIYFTNHVAGVMHRYWGDTMPEYAEQFEYKPDEVFKGFVTAAMEVFDRHLGRIMSFLERDPQSVLIVASSMGQAAIPYKDLDKTYVLKDADRLASALELGPVEEGLAMYPRTSLKFPTPEDAERGADVIASVRSTSEPMFSEVRVEGSTVSFAIRYDVEGGEPSEDASYATATDPSTPRQGTIGDLGIATEPRLGGGNTAYHTPDGPMITLGRGVAADPSRGEISVLRAAPIILELLGIGEPQDVTEQQAAASR